MLSVSSTIADGKQGQDIPSDLNDPSRCLPLDLLGEVFRFLPRSRRRILSLVSKRWRLAALRAVTSLFILVEDIEHKNIPSYGAIFSQFPLLKTLAFSTAPETCAMLPLPSTITDLAFRVGNFGFMQPLPSLSTLKLSGYGYSDGLLPLLMMSASALQSLSLRDLPLGLSKMLAALQFSALTHLYLHKLPHSHTQVDAFTVFLGRHSEQLLSLTTADASLLHMHQFTNITHLGIEYREEALTAILAKFPKLCRLSLISPDAMTTVRPLSLLSGLTELGMPGITEEHITLDRLAACPNVRVLSCLSQDPPCQLLNSIISSGFAHTLTSLALWRVSNALQIEVILDRCRNLNSLLFSDCELPRGAGKCWRAVTFLTVRQPEISPGEAVALTVLFPRLTSYSVAIKRDASPSDILTMITVLERKGMLSLRLCSSSSATARLIQTRPKAWISVQSATTEFPNEGNP